MQHLAFGALFDRNRQENMDEDNFKEERAADSAGYVTKLNFSAVSTPTS